MLEFAVLGPMFTECYRNTHIVNATVTVIILGGTVLKSRCTCISSSCISRFIACLLVCFITASWLLASNPIQTGIQGDSSTDALLPVLFTPAAPSQTLAHTLKNLPNLTGFAINSYLLDRKVPPNEIMFKIQLSASATCYSKLLLLLTSTQQVFNLLLHRKQFLSRGLKQKEERKTK